MQLFNGFIGSIIGFAYTLFMAFIDYYKVLGIDRTATQADVRKAFRRLAKQYHPDVNKNNPDAQERFQEINEANEVLGDPEKRKKYDEFGENWMHAEEYEAQRRQYEQQYRQQQTGDTAGHGFGGFNFGGFGDFTRSEGNAGGFSDFFDQLFGGAHHRRTRQQPSSRTYEKAELHLTLRDAATAKKQVVSIGNKSFRVTIPAGVADGQCLKLRGHGSESPQGGGERGDLYITFRIAPDPTFTRHGDDLYTDSPLSLTTAVLGGELVVTTIVGETLRLKIKPGTQPNTKLRLRGKGMPVYKKAGERGDLIVTFSISIPTTLTSEQEELFIRLRQLSV